MKKTHYLAKYLNVEHVIKYSYLQTKGLAGVLGEKQGYLQTFFFPLWRCSPTRAMASSFLRFLDHTQRRITVGRTPLDEWSARRRDLYLTTYNTYNRQTSTPQVGFEPTISKGERPKNYALGRTRPLFTSITDPKQTQKISNQHDSRVTEWDKPYSYIQHKNFIYYFITYPRKI